MTLKHSLKKNASKSLISKYSFLILIFFFVILASCDRPESQSNSRSSVMNSTMYYTVTGNLVVVHNTPWGNKSYTVDELPPGAVGGEGGIFVGAEQDPRIKIVFHRDKGVVSVSVDGVKIPKKK
jgi:hypothetical protein